jgi:hypothetical protein
MDSNVNPQMASLSLAAKGETTEAFGTVNFLSPPNLAALTH